MGKLRIGGHISSPVIAPEKFSAAGRSGCAAFSVGLPYPRCLDCMIYDEE